PPQPSGAQLDDPRRGDRPAARPDRSGAMTALAGGSWNESIEDPKVVTLVHRRVGEALTRIHAAHESQGRPRLGAEDERELARKLIADELHRLAADAYAGGFTPLDEAAEDAVMAAVLDRLHGLARLQPLLDDPAIRDIHISGAERVWLNLRDGRK